MESVVLDGVEYVKASVLAKKFRYTSDYIGQLCRGKKVDARLVGRTWFVNPDSITSHKQTKHQRRKDVKTIDKVGNIVVTTESEPVTRLSVAPVVKTKTIKQLFATGLPEQESAEKKLRVAYERDEEELLPVLHRKHTEPPRAIEVRMFGSHRIHISNKPNISLFEASELPEVSLKGTLKVTDYPDDLPTEQAVKEGSSESDITKENKAITDDLTEKEDLASKSKSTLTAKKTVIPVHKKGAAMVKIKPVILGRTDDKKPKSIKSKPVLAKSNVSIPVPVKTFTPELVQARVEQRMSVVVLVSPLLAVLIATVCVVVLFSASSQVEVSDTSYQSSVVLQLANLVEMLRQ